MRPPSLGRCAKLEEQGMSVSIHEPQLYTDLKLHLAQARNKTDELFRLVRDETLYERPVAERHRLIFYLGHVEAFDRNMICRYASPFRPFIRTSTICSLLALTRTNRDCLKTRPETGRGWRMYMIIAGASGRSWTVCLKTLLPRSFMLRWNTG